MFDYCGIPMAGNLANGFAVGLTPDGAALCARLMEKDMELDAVRAVDSQLAECLEAGGFFQKAPEAEGIAPLRVAYLHVTQRCNLNCAGDMQRYVELAQQLGATMNYSLLSCERTDQLAPLISGEEELLQLSATLLAQPA